MTVTVRGRAHTGATMRWQPQVDDEANKGLHILKDLMLPVKQNHPEISLADL